MKYASVCSGIEAATAAWDGLGWEPVWFSQYDPEFNYTGSWKTGPDFPSKVLAYHYPGVPNLGDMTKIKETKTYQNEQFDLLVGGTPCQAFSIAGLRAGLADGRSNLALEYIRILKDKRPRWFVWENVPGVLTSGNGNDFACLLSGWSGHDIKSQKFSRGGVIEARTADDYSIAWRIFDSRHFGVPQRRRRVFVIGYSGKDWRPPFAVLFERESLCRDFTPRREKGQSAAGNTDGSINCQSNGGASRG